MAQVNFRFVANSKGLEDGIKKSQKKLSGFQKSTEKVSKGIGKALGGIGLAIGVGALVSGLKEVTKAAQEDLRSQKLLALQLKTTTKATDDQVASAEDYISSLSKLTGIADDDLRPALANAVRGTGSLQKGQELLKIALDGSVASGKPLDSVLQALIKANSGNTTALYKLAPQLKKTKGGIDDYAKSVKGAAEAGADPFSRMTVAVDEIKEKVGTLLLPTVQKFADYFTNTVSPQLEQFFQDVNNPNSETGKTFSELKTLVQGVFDLIVKIGKSTAFKKSLETAIALAMTLLSLAENILSLFDETKNKERGKIGASLIGGSKNKNVLTIANVKLSAKSLGIKNFTDAQAKRAINDMSGGADGNPMTPWPMANGGIVMPRPGGTLAQIGEAGKPEAVIPLDKFNAFGNSHYTINVNKANMTGEEIIRVIKKFEISSGRKFLVA